LFFALARYQDLSRGVLRDRSGRKRIKATVGWVVLMAGFALPLLIGVTAGEARYSDAPVTPELAAPEISLAWLCFCSLFLSGLLFRPWAMRMSPRIAVTVVLVLAGVLAASAVLEEIWRRGWYLYTLTSITFVGTSLAVWRLVESLDATNLERTTAAASGPKEGAGP